MDKVLTTIIALACLSGCVAQGDTGPVDCRHKHTGEVISYRADQDGLALYLVEPEPYLLVNGRKIMASEWECKQRYTTGETVTVKTCNGSACWKPAF